MRAEAGTVLWRAENDKLHFEHKNPLHAEAVVALKRERSRVSAIGDAFVFPSEKHAGKPAPTWQVSRWWEEFSRPIDFGDEKGWGWHSMRRAFANTLRNVALRDLKGPWRLEDREDGRLDLSAAVGGCTAPWARSTR